VAPLERMEQLGVHPEEIHGAREAASAADRLAHTHHGHSDRPVARPLMRQLGHRSERFGVFALAL
jgi:hypothetical protein